MATSTLGAVSLSCRLSIRMALPLAMLLLVAAAAPVIAGPYDAEIAQVRTDIGEKLDLISGQQDRISGEQDRISGFEDDLVALDHQIIDNDSAISTEDIELRVLPVRLELLADQFIRFAA